MTAMRSLLSFTSMGQSTATCALLPFAKLAASWAPLKPILAKTAIRALSSDTNSRDFLVGLFQNKEESAHIREASAHALDGQDPGHFLEKSIEAFKDDDEKDDQFLTGLLSRLLLSEDLPKIQKDADLLHKLNAIADREGGPKGGSPQGFGWTTPFRTLLNQLHMHLYDLDQ